ncbi:MAG: DUF1801 domain-containing protein [Candidatus Kapabacteria bacterium]|nr:DUF1801 domain-containing protein [Candidatus Kapabacteria bacterium]
MATAQLKTQATDSSVTDFLARISDEGMRADCLQVRELMFTAMGALTIMWGANFTLCFMDGLQWLEKKLETLGKYTLGKSCLYIERLADVDL